MYDYEKKHLHDLRSGLAECTVLLKCNGDFPLAEACPVAAYGNGVRHTIKGGTGSGEVNSRFSISVEKGLEKAGFTVTTKDWLALYDEVLKGAKKQFLKDVKKRARAKHTMAVMEGMGAVMPEPEYELPIEAEGDVAIYVLSRISGEGNDRKPDRGDFALSETEIRDILAIQAKYAKFMLVINAGGPVDLTPVVNEVQNILVLSQLGVETGYTLATILLGKENPSGKLTTTWAAMEDYCQEGEFGCEDDTEYREGIYVGYRYFNSVGKKPLFPFGYGLSYTTFDLHTVATEVNGTEVCVTAEVENTGCRAGKEVVQVYLSKPEGQLDQPYQELAGFAKTSLLAPGQKETVKVVFSLCDIASYDAEKASYVLEEGKYIVRSGNCSLCTEPAAVLTLEETVITRQVRNALGTPGFDDYKPEKVPAEELLDSVPVIPLDPAVFETETIIYDQEPEIDDFVKKLSNEQLALINVGAFESGGMLSVIGSASTSVAGAAGQSTSKIPGLPAIIMADGPAGLRLSKEYFLDEKGAHSLSTPLPESMTDFLPKPAVLLLNRKPRIPKGSEVMDQYATAIPIGTAIAQSFNLEFARICGDIVGAEMEKFHVNLWLAPALNIHRSVLCGRNFEYFSEDPYISGRMAAAITLGVQKHPGCGTTIKHYAANNQETNRYANNSKVSERAMREIYLRGFELCVKESQPKSVMTSYNLINGTHTSERRDLVQDILRDEFGFQGIVMTDWVIAMMVSKGSKYEVAKAGKVAAASGELFMPGNKKDYENVLAMLEEGVLTREQLEVNATRVYHMALQLND